MKITCVGYLNINDSTLMLYRNKKENDINKGKWLGIGGKKEENENIEDTLIREFEEETNLFIDDIKHRGIIEFIADGYIEIVYVYEISDFSNSLTKDCSEGELQWISNNKILDLNLWEGDRIFLKDLYNSNEYFEYMLEYKNGELINVLKYEIISIEKKYNIN